MIICLFLAIMTTLLLSACGSSSNGFLHSYTPWEVTKESTCAEEGVETRTCIICGEEETRSIPLSPEHGEGSWQVVEAYCEENGEQELICGICHKPVRTEEIGPLGHAFGEWYVSKQETCVEDGEETRKCPRCQKVETRIIAKTHIYEEWTITSAATCTKEGERRRTCSRCGEVEVEVLPALEHVFSSWKEAKAVKCTEKGSEVRHCEICGKREERDIEALGHSFSSEWFVDEEAGCYTTGRKTHHCVRCNIPDEGEEIPAGHVFDSWVTAQAATCAEKGVQRANCLHCSYVETREIAEKGHVFTDWEEKISPTCTVDGLKSRVCEECGTEETKVILAKGHSFSGWKTTTEATCLAEGVETRRCSVCNEAENKKISVLGHEFSSQWTIDIPATCTVDGERSHHCTRKDCVAKENIQQIAALGHIDDDRDGECDHNCGLWMVEEVKEVFIRIEDKFTFAGDERQELTFSYLSEKPEEELDIRLSREDNEGIGEYDIIGQWNVNPYYNVTFTLAKYYIADKGLLCEYRGAYDGYFVTGYKGEESDVIILGQYSDGIHGLKNIVGIDTIAFKNNLDIRLISIGKNVEYIGNGVFSGCTFLQRILFEDADYWYRLKASEQDAIENWENKIDGTLTALNNGITNARNFVNSDEYVDYYWYKKR